MSVLFVVRPGLHTTVQDLGRYGFEDLGVPRAGALDELSARLANRLVGNPDEAAVLECTLRAPAVRFSTDTVVAVVGRATPSLEGSAMPTATPVRVPAGTTLDVGTVRSGVRAWVAVAGGIDVPVVLGSRSTDTLSGLGGHVLRAADELPVGRPISAPAPPTPQTPDWPPQPADPTVLRYVGGPHVAGRPLARSTYTVTPHADRTGLRLDGPALPSGTTVASHGLVAGCVQVPPDGRPVVLLANHQSTGGYPVVATVIRADLALAAQLRPGARVSFVEVSVAAARAAWARLYRTVLG